MITIFKGGNLLGQESQVSRERFSNEDDQIDLLNILKGLLSHWKSIILITIVGTTLSVFFALSISKVYRTSLTFALPSVSDVVSINNNGINSYTKKTLFKEYYDKLRSRTFFRQFIIQHGYLEKLYPEKYLAEEDKEKLNDRMFSKFAKSFKVVILEPVVKKNVFNNEPTQIRVSFEHGNEPLIVELINHYAAFTNESLFVEIEQQQAKQRREMIAELNKQIKLLREKGLIKRKLLIDRLVEENNEKVASLEQQKSIVIAQAAADRETKIALQEESNLVRLNELEQQRDLLIKQEDENRKSEIAIAEEARTIAKSLNIVHPTQLDGVNKEFDKVSGQKTQINLSAEQELPLYLMGTKYIDAYLEALKARKDRTIFLKKINKIEAEISKVKDDQALKILKSRQDDAPYLEQINQIEAKIREVENDQKLKALKARQSDDPFIEELPEILNQIEELELKSLNFRKLQASTKSDDAIVTNVAIKPNRPLIAIVGSLFSGFLAVLYGLLSVGLTQRRT